MTAASSPEAIPLRENVDAFAAFGITAFTTTRATGDYGLGDGEPKVEPLARWHSLVQELTPVAPRVASARQVHGVKILEHKSAGDGVPGWVRHENADGHLTVSAGVACIVTIADCVPVFIAHPGGAAALLHAGWRGTAGGIVQKGIARMVDLGLDAADMKVHLGPSICGRCYQVGPDVFEQLTGWQTVRQRHVDLRALLAEQAKEMGVKQLSASPHCTVCDNERFFSHRAGDAARQVAVIVSAKTE